MKTADEQNRCRQIVNETAEQELNHINHEREFWGKVHDVFAREGYDRFLGHFNNFPTRIFGDRGMILGFFDSMCTADQAKIALPSDILEFVQCARSGEIRAFHESVGGKIAVEFTRNSIRQSIIKGARNELRLRGIVDLMFSKDGLPDEFYVGNQQLRQQIEDQYVRNVLFNTLRQLILEHKFSFTDLIG